MTRPVLLSRVGKLLALANRPGTPGEGAAARALAERAARREGMEVVDLSTGEAVVVDEFHADLLRRLDEIATGKTSAGEIGGTA